MKKNFASCSSKDGFIQPKGERKALNADIPSSSMGKASETKMKFVHPEKLAPKVGLFSVVFFTLVGTIIGGGIVGIPYATLQSGFWLGLIIHALNIVF
jgi:hypothetical protein